MCFNGFFVFFCKFSVHLTTVLIISNSYCKVGFSMHHSNTTTGVLLWIWTTGSGVCWVATTISGSKLRFEMVFWHSTFGVSKNCFSVLKHHWSFERNSTGVSKHQLQGFWNSNGDLKLHWSFETPTAGVLKHHWNSNGDLKLQAYSVSKHHNRSFKNSIEWSLEPPKIVATQQTPLLEFGEPKIFTVIVTFSSPPSPRPKRGRGECNWYEVDKEEELIRSEPLPSIHGETEESRIGE